MNQIKPKIEISDRLKPKKRKIFKELILFLKSNLTGIITFSELDWITSHQSDFTRLVEYVAIKLSRMLDAGSINIGCRLKS